MGNTGEHISYSEIELSKEDLSEKPRKGRKNQKKQVSEMKLPMKKSISQDCKYAECNQNEFITKLTPSIFFQTIPRFNKVIIYI